MGDKKLTDLYKDDEIEIFSDKLNHFSILQGIALTGKKQTRYKNVDLNHLETLLKKSIKKHKIVITESVFSMDGTIINIDNLIELKRKYNFILYLDEAHSFGLYGNNGYGISEKYADEIEPAALLLLGQFGTISTVLNRRLQLWAIVMTVSRASWAHRLKDSGEVLQLLQRALIQSEKEGERSSSSINEPHD